MEERQIERDYINLVEELFIRLTDKSSLFSYISMRPSTVVLKWPCMSVTVRKETVCDTLDNLLVHL